MKKLTVVGLLVYVFAVLAVWATPQSCEDFFADYAIVFGDKLHKDGRPSMELQARMDTAVKLYHSDRVGKILVSGDLGDEGHFEADVMARYLVDQGVAAEDILRDNRSADAYMTSQNAARRLEETASVVAITDRYHVIRARIALRHAGFREVYGYYPRDFQWQDLLATSRELPVLLQYWFRYAS